MNTKNETTSYTYDLNGNMLTQTDGKGNITGFEYNVMNKPVKKTDPGDCAKFEAYTYYANGNLHTKTDRNGKTATYTYDCHNRLLSQIIGTDSISYTYDSNGNQLDMIDSTGTTTRTYDELNRVKTKAVPDFGTTTFVYDITDGLPTGYTAETSTDFKGNIKKTVYDKVGRIYQVIADSKTTAYEYYDNGNKQKVIYPDGTKQEYTYYKDNLIWTLTTKKPDGSITDFYSYEYDGAHNQLTKYEKINGAEKGTTVFTYDDLNRLLTVTEPAGKTTEYTYDTAGNRSTEKVTQGGSVTFTDYRYNGQNRLTSSTAAYPDGKQEITRYTYDGNGNLNYKGKETIKAIDSNVESIGIYIAGQSEDPDNISIEIYRYDVWNQMISTVTGNQTVSCRYNGEGLRVEKTVNGQATRFLYEYDKVILETDGTGSQKAWNVYGNNLISRKADTDTAFYVYNGHGDVAALLNGTGTVLASYYYDAFGNPLETTGTIDNPFRYAGYQYDGETGLYYCNARYYDSKIARFLSEDTYTGNTSDPLSLNLYTYCANNPIIYIDPTGHVYVTDPDEPDAGSSYILDVGYGFYLCNGATLSVRENDRVQNINIISTYGYGNTLNNDGEITNVNVGNNSSVTINNDGTIVSITTGKKSTTDINNSGVIGLITTGQRSETTIFNVETIGLIESGDGANTTITNSKLICAAERGKGFSSLLINGKRYHTYLGNNVDYKFALTNGDIAFLFSSSSINNLPINKKAEVFAKLKTKGKITGDDLISLGLAQRKKGIAGWVQRNFNTTDPDGIAALLTKEYLINQRGVTFARLMYEEMRERQAQIDNTMYFLAASTTFRKSIDVQMNIYNEFDRKNYTKFNFTEGTGKAAGSAGNKTLLSGSEWNKYFQETYGAQNVKWMPQSFEHMVENPQTLYGCTQSEVAKILGDGWTASPYGNSGTGWKFINNDHPDLMVFQHNADGVHGGAYYGFSSGTTGTVKLVGNDYIPLPNDKATIIQMGN